jgi:DNA-binding GntR family transcriptional regulator
VAKSAHSKADAVYGELKEAILTGALEPGCLIDKATICQRLGVSRFPVSAAVSRLAYDRLVDVAPQRGSFVSRISINDVAERLFIRSALEGEIAADAARRMSRSDKNALASNIEESRFAVEADDRAMFYATDVAFHRIFTARLRMIRASEILDNLRVHLERVRRLLMSPRGRIREVLREHEAIVAAIELGDPAGAREAMKRHLGVTGELLAAVARQRPEMFSP